MPAPQILPKYSPAFKRKSLSVYNTSSTNSSPTVSPSSPIKTTPLTTDAPKSLESLCSPTRSDCSFDFVSSNSSPDNLRTKPRFTPKSKTRADYDDSDNDSAVSSSQSSISRGFSPPTSPVPSDRSYVSLETSYQRRTFLLNNNSNKSSYSIRDHLSANNKDFSFKLNNSDAFIDSGKLSPGEKSPLSPTNLQTFEKIAPRATQIPQRQVIKRSSSTETNCSSSSTLTTVDGSQASPDSLSKRILKPHSVEAINRKNILASAKCRSGRDLNGSPLIQRKFSSEEALNSNKV